MKIAVNMRLLLKDKLEGIGKFSFEIFKRITKEHPEHKFIFIFDRPYHQSFLFSKNITPIILYPPTRHPLLWWYWFEYRIPRFLKNHNIDLFISPDGFLSLNSSIKQIAVIHDLNFEHFPKNLPYFKEKYYRFFFPKYALKANKIITVSEFSKNDIITKYNIDKNKIDVIYNGVNDSFKVIHKKEKEKTKEIYSMGLDYFIYVGALNPRKNLSLLLQAFNEFKEKSKTDKKLLIVGEKMFLNKKMFKLFNSLKHKSDIIFTGRVPQITLEKTIASSSGLFLISKFEGFGIPIIEAMASGVPVVTSNISAMPEIAGDAALLVNPKNVNSVIKAMDHLSNNNNEKLIEKGLNQAKKFNWNISSQKMWDTIETILNA